MKMTQQIIKDFEVLGAEALIQLAQRERVKVKSSYEDKVGFITKTPWFEVAHLEVRPLENGETITIKIGDGE